MFFADFVHKSAIVILVHVGIFLAGFSLTNSRAKQRAVWTVLCGASGR